MTNEEKYKGPEERRDAFYRFCDSHVSCSDCTIYKNREAKDQCTFLWLTLEADEEEPIPCPYCGGEAEAFSAMYGHIPDGARVRCTRCWAITPVCKNRAEAIAMWNRRAK